MMLISISTVLACFQSLYPVVTAGLRAPYLISALLSTEYERSVFETVTAWSSTNIWDKACNRAICVRADQQKSIARVTYPNSNSAFLLPRPSPNVLASSFSV